jgi:hypothetical protein
LADCYYQAKCVQQTFKHFGVTKRWQKKKRLEWYLLVV